MNMCITCIHVCKSHVYYALFKMLEVTANYKKQQYMCEQKCFFNCLNVSQLQKESLIYLSARIGVITKTTHKYFEIEKISPDVSF